MAHLLTHLFNYLIISLAKHQHVIVILAGHLAHCFFWDLMKFLSNFCSSTNRDHKSNSCSSYICLPLFF